MSKFLIKLHVVHEASGKTVYRVAKESGLVYNTVNKYTSGPVEADILSPEVVRLANYYGVDWRDPAVIEIVYEEGDTQPVKTIDDDESEYVPPLAEAVSQ